MPRCCRCRIPTLSPAVDFARQSGTLVEKYDVLHTGRSGGGGEYPTQDGFGWTNGVVRKLIALYPADAAYVSPDQCPKDQMRCSII
jgi:alpha,alpha-trehalase